MRPATCSMCDLRHSADRKRRVVLRNAALDLTSTEPARPIIMRSGGSVIAHRFLLQSVAAAAFPIHASRRPAENRMGFAYEEIKIGQTTPHGAPHPCGMVRLTRALL